MASEGRVAVARVVGSWGIRGQVRVEVLTVHHDRFAPGARLYIQAQPYTVLTSHRRRQQMVLQLQGIQTPEAAEALRGALLEVPESELRPLPADTFYHFQIMGLEVYTEEGEHLGTVADIIATGSNDVYVVRKEGQEVLLPAIEDVVRSINLAERRLVVQLLPDV